MSETTNSDKNNNESIEKTNEARIKAVTQSNDTHANTEECEVTLQTTSGKQTETSVSSSNATKASENNKSDSASLKDEREQTKAKTGADQSSKSETHPPLTSVPVRSSAPASSEPAPKIITGTAQIRSTTPVVVGARVVTATTSSVQGPGGASLAQVPQAGRGSVSSTAINQPRVTTLTPAKGTVVRISTPSQSVPMTRAPQTMLPANFQVPQGMVLIRSDSGQLMLVSQQALAQAQAQGMLPKPANANASAIVRTASSQATGTATPVIRVSLPPSSASATTSIKHNPTSGAAHSVTGTTVLKPAYTTGTTIIKPANVVATAVRKPTSTMGTVIKASQITPNSSTAGTLNQGTNSVSTTTVINTSAVKETLENVKKCKNFLVTLMKLASSGTRSANMAQNVRALVKGLLDGKLEAEEFTEKLYMELKSSPQPYLVPFLKRSLPAVRQLTPNSQLFIQQCDQLKPSDSASAKTANQKPSISISSTIKPNQPTRPAQLVIQQPKGVIVEQPVISLSAQNNSQPKQLVIQTSTHSTVPTSAVVRQSILQVSKTHFSQPPLTAHAHGFKDSTSGSFRDDDDINDVASMAGVNLSEENARILASGSELVGSVIRSCQEEPFLFPSALQTQVLHIGGSLGITEVCPDVFELLSLATKERLGDLLEKLTAVAQHRQISYRDDWRYSQTNDTRSQLKFLEQLDRLEKQRREEDEREALLRIARSRSNSEDPEQQRLRQRAKEMQQLELAQMEHRDANLAALAALGPRKRKALEASGPGANQLLGPYGQLTTQRAPIRVTMRDLTFCMEQDPTLRHSLKLYSGFLR
ncbi:transcription initiation factor TFIID subunit 4 [Myxocyprinus asiaticus]|uniref:transcription initiation factor TFIID subunit 4 n=1 Tax=Myxocyprinus asiaticus TaxID=70543 RepID=UPI0022227D7D|nr:transcription initiation factor TFIID subunit 4 [Myxocyprinus asiaticus]